MKYVLLVSHGMFAPGLHSALNMLAGGEGKISSRQVLRTAWVRMYMRPMWESVWRR